MFQSGCINFVFRLQFFDRMKIENPTYRSQVQVVKGDCFQPNIGVDEAVWNRIASKINVVIHLAAATTTDNHPYCMLHTAVYTNVRATRDLIVLTKCFQNLKVRSFYLGEQMIFKKFTLHKLYKHIPNYINLISFSQYFSLQAYHTIISIVIISFLFMIFLKKVISRYYDISKLNLLLHTKITTEMVKNKRFPPKFINSQVITPIITVTVPLVALNSGSVIFQVNARNGYRIPPIIALYP